MTPDWWGLLPPRVISDCTLPASASCASTVEYWEGCCSKTSISTGKPNVSAKPSANISRSALDMLDVRIFTLPSSSAPSRIERSSVEYVDVKVGVEVGVGVDGAVVGTGTGVDVAGGAGVGDGVAVGSEPQAASAAVSARAARPIAIAFLIISISSL